MPQHEEIDPNQARTLDLTLVHANYTGYVVDRVMLALAEEGDNRQLIEFEVELILQMTIAQQPLMTIIEAVKGRRARAAA